MEVELGNLFFNYLQDCDCDIDIYGLYNQHCNYRDRDKPERKEREMAAMGESPRSPEARLGMRVEDLWDVQEPQLSPNEKLNACFESIPVSAFPSDPSNQGNLFIVCFNSHVITGPRMIELLKNI